MNSKKTLPNVRNSKIGFTSRIESRKNIHYLNGFEGVVLSNQYDWKNITENSDYDFSKYKFYQWDINILEPFMKLNWGISHSCHTNEPFGYSIFQVIDWGKLPIIHEDWEKNVITNIVKDLLSFQFTYNEILRDTRMKHLKEFMKLKSYMKKFDNKKKWIQRKFLFSLILNIYVYTIIVT